MANAARTNNDAKWSLIFWCGAAAGVFLYGLWCAYDGWVRTDHEYQLFNQIAAPICFVVAGWLVWQGVKESRQIKEKAAKAAAEGAVQAGQKGEESERM